MPKGLQELEVKRIKDLNKKMKKILSLVLTFSLTSCKTETLQTVLGQTSEILLSGQKPSDQEIGLGLKEALTLSIEKGAQSLSQRDGFLTNEAVKIFLPPEIKEIQSSLRKVGLGQVSDELTIRLNRAAEDAAVKSVPIFKKAIFQMTFKDVMSVLTGPNDAATNYLKKTTSDEILQAFKPEISKSLNKVGAAKLWRETFVRYNAIPFVKKVNTDLTAYTSGQALEGLFHSVSLREQDIRQSSSFRATPLLKKVFSYAESLK